MTNICVGARVGTPGLLIPEPIFFPVFVYLWESIQKYRHVKKPFSNSVKIYGFIDKNNCIFRPKIREIFAMCCPESFCNYRN